MERLAKQKNLLAVCRNSILELMRAHDIHISQLAREINVPQPTMHRLLKGKIDDIKLTTLLAIADFFSVNIEDLIKNKSFPSTSISPVLISCRNVPIVTWKEAAYFPNLDYSEQREYVCASTIFSEKAFALVAKASFMPTFVKGTILIVETSAEPIDGDYVVAIYPGSSEATLRLIVFDGPNLELKRISGGTNVEPIKKGISIIGTVLQSTIIHRNV